MLGCSVKSFIKNYLFHLLICLEMTEYGLCRVSCVQSPKNECEMVP